MYLTTLETNLKSPDGATYTVPLDRLTLLLGKNEANKSAVAEAAMLAKTGSVLGLPYKDKPMKGAEYLATLIPIGNQKGRLEVEAHDTNGRSYTFEYERGSRAKRTGPEATVLVMGTLREKLGASDNARAVFLYDHLKPPLGSDFHQQLTAELSSTLRAVAPGEQDDLVTKLKAVEAQIKLNKETISTARLMQSLPGTARAVSEQELAEAWGQLRATLLRTLGSKLDPWLSEPLRQKIFEILIEEGGGVAAMKKAPAWEVAQEELTQKLVDARMATAIRVAATAQARASVKRAHLDSLREVLLGQIYRAISGSTEQRFLTALACAMAKEGDLLVMADRAFDPETLTATMRALTKAPCQVLLTSPIKPKGRKPAGWHYVELERKDGAPLQVRTG